MKFVDLNRSFRQLREDDLDEEKIEAFQWSLLLSAEYHWEELLKNRYVMVLGEAGIGKSKELLEQAQKQLRGLKRAFYVLYEDLLDQSPRSWFSPADLARFEAWKGSNEEATFFLDSVDEAKIRDPKAFARGMASFHNHLKAEWNRVRIVVSCRLSDWSPVASMAEFSPYFVSEVEQAKTQSIAKQNQRRRQSLLEADEDQSAQGKVVWMLRPPHLGLE